MPQCPVADYLIHLTSLSPAVKLQCATIEMRPAANITKIISGSERRRRKGTARVQSPPQENA